MAIKLISESERLEWVWPKGKDVKIYYRRVPDDLRKQWRDEAEIDPETGQPNYSEIGEKGLRYAILDWQGFEDQNGKPVPYSYEAFAKVPDGIRAPFVNVLLAGVEIKEADEKNSAKPSGAG